MLGAWARAGCVISVPNERKRREGMRGPWYSIGILFGMCARSPAAPQVYGCTITLADVPVLDFEKPFFSP